MKFYYLPKKTEEGMQTNRSADNEKRIGGINYLPTPMDFDCVKSPQARPPAAFNSLADSGKVDTTTAVFVSTKQI
jgi:hypothetical protein